MTIENKYTSWNTLPLSKFIEIGKIEEDNPVNTQAIILSILTDTDEETIMNLPLSEYTKLAKSIQYLYQRPVPKPVCPSRLEINGKRYKVCQDVREWTAAQFIDFQSYLQRGQSLDNLPSILSTAIVPYSKKYNEDYDINETIEAVKSLSVKTIIDMSAFFFDRWMTLSKATAISLALRTMRMRRKVMKASRTRSKGTTLENGDGQGQ